MLASNCTLENISVVDARLSPTIRREHRGQSPGLLQAGRRWPWRRRRQATDRSGVERGVYLDVGPLCQAGPRLVPSAGVTSSAPTPTAPVGVRGILVAEISDLHERGSVSAASTIDEVRWLIGHRDLGYQSTMAATPMPLRLGNSGCPHEWPRDGPILAKSPLRHALCPTIAQYRLR
jgi:hypothetical protein